MTNWLAKHRRISLALICLFWTGLIFLGRALPTVPFLFYPWSGEQAFEDSLRRDGRKTATRDEFVYLGLDEESRQLTAVGTDEIATNRAFQLMTEKPFPWNREIWSILLDRLIGQAGAKLVMFDLVFNPPNDGDPFFHAALDKYRDHVVIGANFDRATQKLVIPNAALIPEPQIEDDRVGVVNFFPDPNDGKVRSANYRLSERLLIGMEPVTGEPVYQSMSARGIHKLGHAADVPPGFSSRVFRFSADDAYPPRKIWEVFDDKIWNANYRGGAFFKDKIVIIGDSSPVVHDVVNTPIDPALYGPALHLHAMAAALAHEFLSYTPPAIGYALVGVGGLLAWCVVALVRRPVISIIAIAVMVGAYLLGARLLYDTRGFFLLVVPVLTAFVLSGVFSLGFEYILERIEKNRTRRTLERYVSKNIVREVLDNPGGFYGSMKGARKPVTVLFSDIVGFTTLSEHADPEQLVSHLNEYLSGMVGVVFENNGTLDKFIGDAIMAVWGNVLSAGPADDAKACARTALGMRRQLVKLNAGWKNEGRMTLGMGVGINHGEALVGNIGSYAPHERLDPTVIGDAVNLASRLEGLTRTYGVDILVGESAIGLISDEFHLRTVARVQVKGKTIPVGVSTILCAKGDDYDAERLKWLESYEEAIGKFLARDFTGAKILFSRFLEFYPEDYLAKMYLDRALHYEEEAPEEAWSGVEVFTKK